MDKITLKSCFVLLIFSLLIPLNSVKAQTFERVETFAGLGLLKENNGVSVADYDGDNDLDLFVVAKAKDKEGVESSHSRLFKNNNDGTFTDVTQASGLINLLPESEPTKAFSGLNGEKHGAFWGDYDNDGYPDLFLTHTNKNQLFHNQGNGTFVDVTDVAGFKKHNPCIDTGATWFDYNKDGFLDIYICDWSKDCEGNRLYKNNKDGTFTNVTNELFPPNLPDKYAFLAMPFDFNNDGWLDLFIANDSQIETDEVFINNQGNGFTEQSALFGLANSKNDMGVAVGDYNNDGFFDFYTTAIFDNTLFKNNKNNTFKDVAESLGVKKTGWAWDVSFSDFDLDRDEDLFVANGFVHGSISSQNNVYFENLFANNNGKEQFIDSSEKTKLGELTISVGSTVFDFDNDGDLDIYVTNNDKLSFLYENKITDFTQPRNDLHWSKISLQGTVSNRDAIGTIVSVKTNDGTGGTLYRYNTGVGFLSQSLKPVHFGLGSSTEILELKISWPSGLVEIYKNIPLDKLILAKEGDGYKVLEIEPSKKVYGCMDSKSCNYNPFAITSSGSCSALKASVISGKTTALINSIETYTYPLLSTSQVSWQVTGGQIVEGGLGGQIKVRWGTGSNGVVSLIENNSQCFSGNIILNVSLTNGEVVVVPEEKVSVARLWNEALLQAIRKDYARPTVHARNLFHTSLAMYDAWAVYSNQVETYLLGKEVHGFKSEFNGFVPSPSESIENSRNKAISYAAYRLMTYRFQYSPNTLTQGNFDALMVKLGYDKSKTSVDYSNGDAAALGNYIAQTAIDYGLVDGSNEINQYKNIFYKPVNEPLSLSNPGDEIDTIDPNRWQPLKFESFIDQSGNLLAGTTPSFLSPEWGNVFPFSMGEDDKKSYSRLGNSYAVYYDPGTPPHLSTSDKSKESDLYKWAFTLVAKWSSHLSPTDGVIWDISPKSIGNVNVEFPQKFSDYPNFYKEIDGGDIGKGRAVNPYTKMPYVEQKVPRGDYTRVLAEFWADGPSSETPPGHWFTVLNYVSDSKLLLKKLNGQGAVLSNLEWDIKAYFVLGGAMHDCAISAWGIKGWYDYIRPLSAIRYMANKGQSSDVSLPNYNVAGIPLQQGFVEVITENDPLVGPNKEHLGEIKLYAWKGHEYIKDPSVDQAGAGWVLAQNWWSYQRPSFVTPPFAGYISGHSTYSRAAAEVMTLLTGDEYFPGGYGEFIAHKNEFLVFEEGPSVDVKLQWATYRDASDQCSLSRIWGGIHPPIDDIPGRIIGEKIGKNAFQFALGYFNNENFNIDVITDVAVYPNPVVNKLTVDTKELNSSKNVYVYDMQGKMILDKVTTETKFEIDLESLTKGVYLLNITIGKNSVDKLILKK